MRRGEQNHVRAPDLVDRALRRQAEAVRARHRAAVDRRTADAKARSLRLVLPITHIISPMPSGQARTASGVNVDVIEAISTYDQCSSSAPGQRTSLRSPPRSAT